MHKKYTSQAGKVLELAAKLSRKLQHNYVGTEHILAGLLQERSGPPAAGFPHSDIYGSLPVCGYP